jgi:hypothetical protein
VLIRDNEEDLNWHAFRGHSIDMQGFRAAEFAGVDPLTRSGEFIPLKTRGIGVATLGALWDIPEIRQHLLHGAKGTAITSTYTILEEHGGKIGRSLAEAFRTFPWRKGHWTIRALLENSARLKDDGYSFRRWLEHQCGQLGMTTFPPEDFREAVHLTGGKTPLRLPLERALRVLLERTFYQVGPALAAYVLCDWQLELWNNGKTGLFETFKKDSFHDAFVAKYGRGQIPATEEGFTDWWHGQPECGDLPPRLANECIWLGMEYGVV